RRRTSRPPWTRIFRRPGSWDAPPVTDGAPGPSSPSLRRSPPGVHNYSYVCIFNHKGHEKEKGIATKAQEAQILMPFCAFLWLIPLPQVGRIQVQFLQGNNLQFAKGFELAFEFIDFADQDNGGVFSRNLLFRDPQNVCGADVGKTVAEGLQVVIAQVV